MILYTNSVPQPDAYYDLFESTGWNREYQLSPDELFSSLLSSWYMVSAYADDRLVGFGRILSDGILHALIVDLIVLPQYQGQGIGASLLDKLVAQCQAHGVRDIQLFCAKGKEGFYARYGFVARPADAPGMEYKPLKEKQGGQSGI